MIFHPMLLLYLVIARILDAFALITKREYIVWLNITGGHRRLNVEYKGKLVAARYPKTISSNTHVISGHLSNRRQNLISPSVVSRHIFQALPLSGTQDFALLIRRIHAYQQVTSGGVVRFRRADCSMSYRCVRPNSMKRSPSVDKISALNKSTFACKRNCVVYIDL